MVKSYGILLAFIIQIESFHFQIFMCPFDRKPTITFANPANLELPQNVEGILCPRAFTSNGNTMLRENPVLMTITCLIFNWYTVLLLAWYNFQSAHKCLLHSDVLLIWVVCQLESVAPHPGFSLQLSGRKNSK